MTAYIVSTGRIDAVANVAPEWSVSSPPRRTDAGVMAAAIDVGIGTTWNVARTRKNTSQASSARAFPPSTDGRTTAARSAVTEASGIVVWR